jgi:hypothetical protein
MKGHSEVGELRLGIRQGDIELELFGSSQTSASITS